MFSGFNQDNNEVSQYNLDKHCQQYLKFITHDFN